MNGRIVLPLLLTLTVCIAAGPVHADSPEEQLAAASALFDAKKFDEAARRLDAFLAANPRHPKVGAAALALGRARMERKQYAAAVSAFEKARASKDAAVTPIAQLGLGEAAMYAGQYEKAVTALTAAAATRLKPEQAAIVAYWLGQAYFQLGRFAQAEEAYTRVTRDHGKSPFIDGAYFGAGVSALRQNKTDIARQNLRAVVDRFPKSADRAQALFLLARMDLEAKRWREARGGFETFLNSSAARNEGADVRTAAEEGLVRSLLELGDYAAATSRLEATLARLPAADPQRARVQLSLGHTRYRQKQYDTALAAYREAARSSEAAVAAEGLYWAANATLALKRPNEATPLFRQVVERYGSSPQAAKARTALTSLAQSSNDPAALAASLRGATPAERARGTLRLARLYLGQKKYAAAVAPLTELLQGKPAAEIVAEAQYLLGVAYDGQEKTAPAVAALTEAVRRGAGQPWMGDAQTRLAWLSLERKQPANAERASLAALALKPTADGERQARLALLQAQLDQQKWDAALQGAQALLAGNPSPETRAAVLFTQAWVHEKRGQAADALPLWEQLAREYPKNLYAAEALLHIGDARSRAERHDEARSQYAALIAAFPQSPVAAEARFKLGTTLYNLNRYADAAREWDTLAADKKAGDYAPEALYWSGVALEKGGQKSDAIQRLTRLITAYPTHARVTHARVRLAALKAVSGG